MSKIFLKTIFKVFFMGWLKKIIYYNDLRKFYSSALQQNTPSKAPKIEAFYQIYLFDGTIKVLLYYAFFLNKKSQSYILTIELIL